MTTETPRIPRVRATDAATKAVAALARQRGPLLLVQSAGCCDGSAPMCVPFADFPLGTGDIRLGDVAGVPVYINHRELAAWQHHDLVLDVEPGYADGLSLSPGEGLHFVSRAGSGHLDVHPDPPRSQQGVPT